MWKMRVTEPKKDGQRKEPSYITSVENEVEAAQAIRNLLIPYRVTRIEIWPRAAETPPPPKPENVKVRKIEWREEAHPKGEQWFGYIGERKVAKVFRYTYEGASKERFDYSLFVGGGWDEEYLHCSSIESGKRSAQRMFNKFVQSMVDG